MFKKPSFAKATAGEVKKGEEKKKDESKKEENEITEEKIEDSIETSKEASVEISKERQYLDNWKRCQADFENYRKRQDESRKELKEFILEDLALQILPVVDNFQMSLDHVPEDNKKGAWVQGILHIQRQLETILKENGIEEIKTKEGDEFDPNFHEAVANHETHNMEHGAKKENDNKIAKIFQKGYKIRDKVIRAVKVIVN